MFFFYDTATPEIYTYVHTLSLHDALPIAGCERFTVMRKEPLHLRPAIVRLHGGGGNREAGRMRGPRRCTRHRARAGSAGVALLAVRHGMTIVPVILSGGSGTRLWPRSEAHTSELQSLMRNSYAVF